MLALRQRPSRYRSLLMLDLGRCGECLSGRQREKVGADPRAAVPLGIAGTPAFFVGLRLPADTVRVLERFSGAESFDTFVKVIAAVLAKASTQ